MRLDRASTRGLESNSNSVNLPNYYLLACLLALVDGGEVGEV
ncbi:MAG: hypothetical protein QXS98_08180 [Candidatus Nitrosocaldus sp.]